MKPTIPQFELLSSTIDLMRFPLAVMVVFIHMNPHVVNLIDADFILFSGFGIYNVIGILCSHVITHIAVPCFFLISGFLFFNNFRTWSWLIYFCKIKNRIKSLFIPYILWNLLPFLLLFLLRLGGVFLKGNPAEGLATVFSQLNWHIFYDCNEWGTTRINWLGENLRMTGPKILPLWFVRDLLVVTLLAPFIYFAITKLRIVFVVFLFIAYISRIWPLIPGFDIIAFFYFSLGAYFALNEINIVSFTQKFKWLFISSSVLLLFPVTIYDGQNTIIGQNIYPLFIFCGVFSAFIVFSWLISKYKIKPNKFFVSSCFFVYAFHTFRIPYLEGSPLGYANNFLHILIPGHSILEEALCYLLTPFVTVFICLVVFMIAKIFFPKVTSLFIGNRIKNSSAVRNTI